VAVFRLRLLTVKEPKEPDLRRTDDPSWSMFKMLACEFGVLPTDTELEGNEVIDVEVEGVPLIEKITVDVRWVFVEIVISASANPE